MIALTLLAIGFAMCAVSAVLTFGVPGLAASGVVLVLLGLLVDWEAMR